MALAKDHSNLPGPSGMTPDAEPRFIGVLADAWAEDNDDDKPTAHGTPFRHSDAGKCARALSYAAAQVPKSDPMDLTGVWNVTLGTKIHDEWQAALQARYPHAEVETKIRTVGADGSGHIDAVIRDDSVTIAYELKTIGGFGYKNAVGAARKGSPAEGPKTEHILQASLNGASIDADEVVIGYLAKECISTTAAARFGITDDLMRFACEWTLSREQYEPLAAKEAERVAGVLGLVDEGQLAARKTPDLPIGAEITDPGTGEWRVTLYDAEGNEQTGEVGSHWGCDYCSWQRLCARTGPGRIPIGDAREVAVALELTPKEAA